MEPVSVWAWKWLEWTVQNTPFLTANILTCHTRNSTSVTNNINNVSFLLKCPSNPWRWASTHGTRTQKPSSSIIHFIIYTFSLSTVTRQNILFLYLLECLCLKSCCWKVLHKKIRLALPSVKKACCEQYKMGQCYTANPPSTVRIKTVNTTWHQWAWKNFDIREVTVCLDLLVWESQSQQNFTHTHECISMKSGTNVGLGSMNYW